MNTSNYIFKIIDKNDSGFITVKELRDFLMGEQVDIALINEIIEEVDKDLNMTLSAEELNDVWREILC